MTFEEIRTKYRRIEEAQAKELWDFWFSYTEANCYHGDNCS